MVTEPTVRVHCAQCMFGSLHVSATVAGLTSSFCSRTAFLLAEGLGRPGIGGRSEGHSVNVYSYHILEPHSQAFPQHISNHLHYARVENAWDILLCEYCQYLLR